METKKIIARNKAVLLQLFAVVVIVALSLYLLTKGPSNVSELGWSARATSAYLFNSSKNIVADAGSSTQLFASANSSCTPLFNITPFMSYSYEIFPPHSYAPLKNISQRFIGEDDRGNLLVVLDESDAEATASLLFSIDKQEWLCNRLTLVAKYHGSTEDIRLPLQCSSALRFPFQELCAEDMVQRGTAEVRTRAGVFNSTEYYSSALNQSFWKSEALPVPVQYSLPGGMKGVLRSFG